MTECPLVEYREQFSKTLPARPVADHKIVGQASSPMATNGPKNRFLGGGPKEQRDIPFMIFVGSLVLMLVGVAEFLWSGQGRETWLVVSGTLPFFILTAVLLFGGIGFWLKSDKFSGPELALFVGITLPCSYITLAFAFLWFTDMGHTVIWNSRIQDVTWEEGWIDKADHKDDSDTRHQPSYTIRTAADEMVSTTRSTWLTLVKRFGGQGKVKSERNLMADMEDSRRGANRGSTNRRGSDRDVSDRDGIPEIHTITWDGRESSSVPTSREHIETNYLQAADTSLKIAGVKQDYLPYLVDYPQVTSGQFGQIEFDRVIEQKVKVGGGFHELVDRKLDQALQTLGSKKQCNIVVYVVGTENVGFFQALREHWKEGKKNDICVCIGYTKKKIRWCKIMTYTDRTLFVENLERDVRRLETLDGKGDALVNSILTNINATGDAGYLRKPMADFEFLAPDITMPWLTQALAFLWACVWLSPTIYICIRN